jgi:hypothetical protein
LAGHRYYLIDSVLQDNARLEGKDLSGGDRYRLAGQGVPSFAVRLLPDVEISKAGNFHGFSRLKGLLDCFQNRFQARSFVSPLLTLILSKRSAFVMVNSPYVLEI